MARTGAVRQVVSVLSLVGGLQLVEAQLLGAAPIEDFEAAAS